MRGILRANYALQRANPMMSARLFSTAAAGDYTTIQQDRFYTPQRPVDFTNKELTVFDGKSVTERKFVPWEVKEAGIKNGFGLVGTYCASLLFPMGNMWGACNLFILANYCRVSWGFLSNAVTKVDLLSNGRQVNFTFGRWSGSVVTVDIKDIKKLDNERTLVETMEESSMFPVSVNGKTYYINGQGAEAVKNGEVFRAIINGQSIKV